MSTLQNIYVIEQDKEATGLKYFFVSKGDADVIKAIEYSYVQQLDSKAVYNLAFGDYYVQTNDIIDNVNTNNGDPFKVLHTILSTIPLFFDNYKGAMLMVQGSDGRPEFVAECRQACTKRCIGECKNYNRRINIYRGYVNKYYDELATDYQFIGGNKNEEGLTRLEPYKRYKDYDSVLLFRKNT